MRSNRARKVLLACTAWALAMSCLPSASAAEEDQRVRDQLRPNRISGTLGTRLAVKPARERPQDEQLLARPSRRAAPQPAETDRAVRVRIRREKTKRVAADLAE